MPRAEPEPDLVQLLTPDGERRERPDYPLAISTDEIAGLYRDLVLVRRFDAEATALQRQGELGLWASLLGQEAAQVGAGHALRAQDVVFPSYREHALAWCRGIDPVRVLGLFRGTTLGGWDPREHNFNLYTLVVGAQAPHAVGYAMGVARDGLVGTGDPDRDTAVLLCFGDGATAQGDVNEAFVWAAAANLPIVFFCQNNQWAISAPVATQSRAPLSRRAAGFGFPGVRVDGNDVLAALAVTGKALDDARAGAGPTLIEAYTYRMNPHTTSDDPTRYRSAAEADAWRRRDPIARVRAHLAQAAGFDEEFFDAVERDAEALAERVRAGCRALPEPEPLSLFDHVYAEETDELREQRAEFGAYYAAFDGALA
ncbi:MAG: pyruvate dehydrogenase (acetyl-transferring) E1 component subunit alpha [Actinomycetia bacterium]|nr:pyruvate dehydrogenase (acetyl-transferring) E1 component subunit alpha [Actinomycetes bacterium]